MRSTGPPTWRLLNGRMCSGHIQGRLLKMLVTMAAPQRVLELGTFSGYSALSIAEALEGDATVDTIEVDDELEDFIRKNLSSTPAGSRVRLHIGDAMRIMEGWDDCHFDLIFIDADKGNTPTITGRRCAFFVRAASSFADNTLWDGHVVEQGRHSSQTEGILRFNDIVAADSAVEKAIIPIRDGLTIIRKLPATQPGNKR